MPRELKPAWLVFLVPPAYLALVLALQPARHLGPPAAAPWLGRLLYDDYDVTAMALRGLNAAQGRTAGRAEPPQYLDAADFQARLDAHLPREPRYFLEYPHAALVLFRLPFVLSPMTEPVPSGVSDGSYHNLVEHEPRNPAEERLWRRLRTATRCHALVMTVCLLLLMAVVAAGYAPGGHLAGPAVLCVLPGTLYFALQRFDVVPALLLALSLAALGRRYLAASALCLAAATLVKVYPILLAPLVVRYLAPGRRDLVLWTGCFALGVAGPLLACLATEGWTATLAPYRYQLTRAPEGWTLYGVVLPPCLAEPTVVGNGFRMGTVLLTLALVLGRRPTGLAGLLRRGALVLIPFVALQVFYSPQWLLWLLPLLVPLARPCRGAATASGGLAVLGLVVALDLVTYLSFPVVYDLPDDTAQTILRNCLIGMRGLILALLAALLAWQERPAEEAAHTGEAVCA